MTGAGGRGTPAVTARAFAAVLLLASPALAAPPVEVAFSPGDAQEAVVRVIDSARRSVHLAAYAFTSKPVARALVAAKGRGVDVRAVLDRSNVTGRYSAATFLSRAGVPTRIDGRYAIMHDKFIVVDGVTVETGSFNFTRAAAERNAENVVILRDLPEAARAYGREFDRLWDESRDFRGEAP